MSSSDHHKLKILNFSDAEIVSYPLIIIIGSVQNDGICQSPNQYQDQATAISVSLSIGGAKHYSAELLKEKFRFLVELEEGKNDIRIQYCCEFCDIVLEHHRPTADYSVIPLYVICEGHDGRFQAPRWEDNSIDSACRRITLCSKLLQCVTAEKLYEHGLGRKTFDLNECQVFRSKLNFLTARDMDQVELWETIGREIRTSSIGSDQKKYLAFLSCTKYCGDKYEEGMTMHEDLLAITQGYVALGGGGLALFGTACLYTWPEEFDDIFSRFVDMRLVQKSQFLDDSCYRGTLGACFSTTLGSVLHELFHTFDLGHTEEGIMGRGFDNIYKVFVETNSTDKNKNPDKTRSYQNKIEFKEELESESLLERILAENRKKEFTIIKKIEEVDDTVLTKSCAVLLCYHRWFNSNATKQTSVLSFDPVYKLIKSTTGIRVIEIRNPSTEIVLHSWVFVGRILKFSFQIPEDVIKRRCGSTDILVVEDSAGYVIKTEIEFEKD